MKVVGYVRVSIEQQACQGFSLAAQCAKVEAYVALHDLELIEVIADKGQSAKTLKRPGLQTAQAMIASGKVDGLIDAYVPIGQACGQDSIRLKLSR